MAVAVETTRQFVASEKEFVSFCSHPRLRWCNDANGSIIYHKKTDKTYTLNAEATMLLALCDGKTVLDKLIDLAIGIQNVPISNVDKIKRAHHSWIDWAEKEELITKDFTYSGPPKYLKSKKISKLSEELLESGEHVAGHRCAQVLTRIAPSKADSWHSLGDAEHALENYDAAKKAYEKCLEIDPDNITLKHLVLSLGDGAPPEKAASDYVTQTFDNYADTFDHDLLVDLEYKAPKHIRKSIKSLLPEPKKQMSVLDLGCGTGLMGKEILPWADYIVGVDLSKKMLAKAMVTDAYDEVHAVEISKFLHNNSAKYDLVLAADVLIYFGELSEVMGLTRARINDDGIVAFTLEKGEQPGYELTVSGRYSHNAEYIESLAVDSGFELLLMKEKTLRLEYAKGVAGYVVVMKPA